MLPIENNKSINVLEPSFGSGEFLSYFHKYFSESNIYGFELDRELFNIVNKNNNTLYNEDYLKSDKGIKFDYIIGNPPYFEMPSNTIPKGYEEVLKGRVNIYSLFIKKSIDILRDKGILSFIIPISILSGEYFSKIRKYIIIKTGI